MQKRVAPPSPARRGGRGSAAGRLGDEEQREEGQDGRENVAVDRPAGTLAAGGFGGGLLGVRRGGSVPRGEREGEGQRGEPAGPAGQGHRLRSLRGRGRFG